MAGALGVLWEGGRCWDAERPAAAQLRVLAQDQMALLVSALVPLLSYSDAGREAHGMANRQGPWDETGTAQILVLLFIVVTVSKSHYPLVSLAGSGSPNTPGPGPLLCLPLSWSTECSASQYLLQQ